MRLKTYSAPTLAMAMELVRQEMGENAIIVSTQAGFDGTGARVTAALEDPVADEAAFGTWDGDGGDPVDTAEDLRQTLAFHGVPPATADRLIEAADGFAGEGSLMALAGALDTVFGFKPLAEKDFARPLMLIGPPGAGKTIATAKLATRARRAGRTPMVITTDTRRAGGVEQLQAFTCILGLDLATASTPADLAELVGEATGGGVLIDTAGTNPFGDIEMEDLRELIRAADAAPVMVLAAGGDAMEAAEMSASFAAIGARRLLATRLDIARRLGSLLAAAEVPGVSFTEVSINPHVADGLTAINPVSLARLLMPYQTDSQATPYLKEAAQ
jgi:flagellar biosynthesis protein FlhF